MLVIFELCKVPRVHGVPEYSSGRAGVPALRVH